MVDYYLLVVLGFVWFVGVFLSGYQRGGIYVSVCVHSLIPFCSLPKSVQSIKTVTLKYAYFKTTLAFSLA